MAGEWRETTVGEIASPERNALVGGPFGSNLVSRDYVDHGIPVIRGQNMNGRWVSGAFAYVTAAKAASLEANLARPGDIVFTQRGTLGQVCLVPDAPFDRYLVSRSQMKLTVAREVADPLFFYYVFRSDEQLDYIRQHAIQTGVPHTNLGILRDTPVALPPLGEQRGIAYILGCIDDKIELNRRVNETLEALARAIFKSWFVDFEPVRAKAEGRQPVGMGPATAALFPDSFEDSPLGEMPKGWVVGSVGELLSLGREVIEPGESPTQVFNHYSIPAFDEGRVPYAQTGEQIKSNKFQVPTSCVLLSKLNPRIPRVWLPAVRRELWAVCSTEFLVALPRPTVPVEFLYSLLSSTPFLDVFATLVTGTSGSHQRVKPEHLLGIVTFLPPPEIRARFADTGRPMLQGIAGSLAESQTLATLRDTLLPKLLSGGVRVKEAEKLVGAVT